MTIRCAIYTRKSNDEGLEKEFNTLEAQREAGENYVKSQVHQGWTLIDKHYDDGGFSGGTMKRPALQELLKDIKAGKVDMIVVYKIDRLSRSLLDFSQMIDIFDQHHCSFISVTQNFNTADSMGRLMLNVLLSFAQFEREISGERIRDKIGASKKKGMWTGGRVPLGYNVVNKKLVINEEEAKIVRYVFNRYLEVPSEVTITQELNKKGWKPKNDKRLCSPKEFSPYIISTMVRNPLYNGKIKYKGELYDGEHKAIINDKLYNAVNNIKEMKHKGGQIEMEYKNDSFLNDLLICGCCDKKMKITTNRRGNKRYRYYLCVNAAKKGHANCELGQISAGELECLIIESISPLFKNPNIIQSIANETKAVDISCQEQEVFDAMHSFNQVFNNLTLSGKRELLNLIIDKVVLFKNHLMIHFKNIVDGLFPDCMKEKMAESSNILNVPYNLVKKRGVTKLISGKAVNQKEVDQTLIKAVIRAFQWTHQMEESGVTVREIARRANKDCGYVGKIMRITTLAPDIIQSILEGKQPISLTVESFIRTPIPYRWEEQRSKFGFTPLD